MHNKYLTRISAIAGITVLLGSCLLPGAAAKAATPAPKPAANSTQALEIAPPLIYLNVSPGQTAGTQVLIRDVSNSALTVTGEVNDFVASGEDGTPKVLLKDDSNNPYSAKTWVAPLPTLQLVPKQIKTLPISIHVPADASPGGHYAVIRFTGSAPSLNGTNGVSLSASIGALMLLTVSGNITNSLSVTQFSATHNGKTGSLFSSGPLGFAEVLKNTGNVHEQPIGLVTVKDMFGHKLATLPVNQPPGNILPSSSRKFTQSLDKTVIGNKRLFGHYTAALNLTYGSPKKTLTSSLSFWVIPFKTIAVFIAVLIGGFFALRYALRRYNRRVLEQAQKRPPSDKR
jgi:hypothetical protein